MSKPAMIAVSATAVSAAAIALGVWSGVPSRLLGSFIAAKIQAASDNHVRLASSMDLQVWPTPAVVLRDLSIDGDNPPGVEVKLDRVRVALAWAGLLTGAPHVTEIEVTRPQVRVPLTRERKNGSGQDMPALPTDLNVVVDRVVVDDGSITLVDQQTGMEHRIDGVAATIERPTSPADFVLKAGVTLADQSVSVAAHGTGNGGSRADGVLPVDFEIEAPDSPTVSGLADVRFGDAILSLDASRIEVGPTRLAGQVSVDFGARKPFVSASLETRLLDLAALKPSSGTKSGRKTSRTSPWSAADVGLDSLNYVDGEVKISAARAVYGAFAMSPVKLSGKLRRGTATLVLSPVTIGDGQVQGRFTLEAADASPSLRLQADATDVDLEPVMRDLADFRGFAGHASAAVDLAARGASPRALAASLSGTASGRLHDADIGGQDLARTVGSLAARLMTGRDPQEIGGFKIKDLSGSMRFERGQGSTQDFLLDASLVRMTGQGTIDLPRQAVGFEFKPTLSLSKGQTGLAGSIDIGVPFDVDGPWAAPSVRPGNGLPTISSQDFGLLPQSNEAPSGPRAQPNDIISDIGSLVSDLIANGAKADPGGLDKARP